MKKEKIVVSGIGKEFCNEVYDSIMYIFTEYRWLDCYAKYNMVSSRIAGYHEALNFAMKNDIISFGSWQGLTHYLHILDEYLYNEVFSANKDSNKMLTTFCERYEIIFK